MQIEVTRETGEKQIFLFDNDKIINVGRMSNSDIRLIGEGVSREHLQIYAKEDKVYLLDKESTNGVFVNDERIPSGVEVEFATFFQVKIGKGFYLSLIDHEPPAVKHTVKAPEVVKLELVEMGTRSLREYKRKTKPKRVYVKAQPKKEASSGLALYILLGAIILGAGIWFYKNK